MVAPAGGAPRNDPASKRREVQRLRAQAAAKVDVLKASEDELGDALEALQRNIRGQEARVDGARQAARAERREALRAVAVDA